MWTPLGLNLQPLNIILHWFNNWLIWDLQLTFSWQSNTDVVLTGRKRTLSQPLFYSVCVPAAQTRAPQGPVLVFPALGAVSALSQTASWPTILLWPIGMWVILRWLHMTGCQKLDRVKRKAGISHSSAFLRPFQACTQQEKGTGNTEKFLSLLFYHLSFCFHCSERQSISFTDSSVHILWQMERHAWPKMALLQNCLTSQVGCFSSNKDLFHHKHAAPRVSLH